MTRVVHVVVAGELGGAERLLAALASRPEETGAEHSIALLSPAPALARLFRDANVRVHDRGYVPEGPLPFLWQTLGPREVAWLSAVLSRERAEIAHLHTFASQVLGTRAALRLGVRLLRTEHSTRAFDDPTCWPFSRWSLTRAHGSVAVSRHVQSVVTRRAPWAAGRLRVVPNGVDVEHFAPRPAPSTRTLDLAIVGRLEPRKGVDLAIEAVARVPAARLEVVGDGPSRGSLERLARRLRVGERIRFRGFVDDPRPAIASCHAVLCTSRSEGLGVALLESMAMGRPVLGFGVGGVPEFVEDGRTGRLVPAGHVRALVEVLREAARAPDRLAPLGQNARALVVERFSVRAMCAGYARAYADLVTGATMSRA